MLGSYFVEQAEGVHLAIGKNLKGRECGKGIYQRKDGKHQEKYFDTLPEARNWLADAKYEDKHGIVVKASDMLVDEWFDYWMQNLICDLAPNTKRNYEERYKHNIFVCTPCGIHTPLVRLRVECSQRYYSSC